MQNKIISFNTGRQYSDKGQRIAAANHNNLVLIVDIDRGLEYALLNANLDRQSIMLNYDNENHINIGAELFEGDYQAMNEFINELKDHAAAFPGCVLN